MRYHEQCQGYYNDPVRHYHIECPYIHGCVCGKRQVTVDHVKDCFMVKEAIRKGRTIPMFPIIPPSIPPKQEILSSTCPQCQQKYLGTVYYHRSNECQYYLGCKRCGEKYFFNNHIQNCKGDQKGIPTTLCIFCSTWVPSSTFLIHKRGCEALAREKVHENVPRKTVKDEFSECSLCGNYVYNDKLTIHLEGCSKRISSKFSEASLAESVVHVIDLRSKKGERVVKFKEIP